MIGLVVVAWVGVGVAALLWGRSWLRWLRLRRRPVLQADQLSGVKDGSPVTVGGTTAADNGRVAPWSRLPAAWHEETVRRGHREPGGGYVDWRTDVERGEGDLGILHGGARVEVSAELARQGLFALRAPMIERSYQDNGRERDGDRRPFAVAEHIVRPATAMIVTGTLLVEPDGTRRLIRGGWADGTAEGDPREVRGRYAAYRRKVLIVGGVLLAVAAGLTAWMIVG
ncbi:hypothetical protein J2S43_002899 [Catenuloplanes nepalensis]|uniref:RING-type E3 ubiquitin transferase n=1 Tax=Catenuloplanes nepalensis TaxID=587533 RepID=A0ABT9MSI5_9ACTN|nr:hypothetical protein [Catenuloplanes nepalensis]MDP9794387.1 hypothetical protein [Catenuloplanes nepalensis]